MRISEALQKKLVFLLEFYGVMTVMYCSVRLSNLQRDLSLCKVLKSLVGPNVMIFLISQFFTCKIFRVIYRHFLVRPNGKFIRLNGKLSNMSEGLTLLENTDIKCHIVKCNATTICSAACYTLYI